MWFIVACAVAMPIAYLFAYILALEPEGPALTMEEEAFQMELFLIGAVLGFLGIYLMRTIAWAIKTLTKRK